MITEGRHIEIVTGRYDRGTPEQKMVVDHILGEPHAAERFEVYFHWYNLIHELGHGLLSFNAPTRPDAVDEEVLVNEFAVAYWSLYGEAEKLAMLKDTVSDALTRFTRPVPETVGYVDYARSNWRNSAFFSSFNNYGWFQMSCVAHAIQNPANLGPTLGKMGVLNIVAQPRKTLRYALGGDTPALILENAAS